MTMTKNTHNKYLRPTVLGIQKQIRYGLCPQGIHSLLSYPDQMGPIAGQHLGGELFTDSSTTTCVLESFWGW